MVMRMSINIRFLVVFIILVANSVMTAMLASNVAEYMKLVNKRFKLLEQKVFPPQVDEK